MLNETKMNLRQLEKERHCRRRRSLISVGTAHHESRRADGEWERRMKQLNPSWQPYSVASSEYDELAVII
jgi:hypothetical protein